MYIDNIKSWAENGTELGRTGWNQLPDIQLYMDQVLSILGERLKTYETDGRALTGSMINNYVKSGVISHPEKKRYTKEQLAQLIVIFSLKQVLSITDIKTLLSDCGDTQDFYESFERNQTDAMNNVSAQLRFAIENGDDLKLLALKLSAEANAKRAAAEKILTEIAKAQSNKTDKSKIKKSTVEK